MGTLLWSILIDLYINDLQINRVEKNCAKVWYADETIIVSQDNSLKTEKELQKINRYTNLKPTNWI